MQRKTHFKTIVISDVHLGTSGSKAREATAFIKQYSCDTLILNGDIVDGWGLKKYGVWKKKHTAFLWAILKAIEKKHTKVYYIRGNHDDFLDQVLPFSIGGNFRIIKEMIIESGGRKLYVIHGDIFDLVTKKMKWLAHIGDLGYTFLLWVNKKYNHHRMAMGLPYYSFSQRVKQSIKMAVKYVSNFEEQLCEVARSKGCEGIVCGHIHQPALKEINGIMYMNSGDWVENMSALVEDYEGNWEIIYYAVEKKLKEYGSKKSNKHELKPDKKPGGSEVDCSYAHFCQLK